MASGRLLDTIVPLAAALLERRLGEGQAPIPAFREVLRSGTERLFAGFDDGVPVVDLVAARSRLVDTLVEAAWRRHLPADSCASLVAVGGYGRGELHPASDVDILILLPDDAPAELSAMVGELITFLWDIGLEVGHGVRTVAGCVAEAEADVTVITNLIEARHLTGDPTLLEQMRAATAPEHIWPSDRFFAAKIEEQRARWQKFGDTAYNLEPNIKENPGGLRDIQMIGWVAKRHFGAKDLHDLVSHGFLTEGEYLTLEEGQTLLWRIRFQLHRIARRHEDRLLFDYQRTLARDNGFVDGDDALAVERFMQQYYRTVMELNRLNEMLLQLFEEAILLHDRVGPPQAINKRFQSRSGYLEVTHKDVFRQNAVALLEVFHILQTHPQLSGVRASTIRLIRENRHHIDDKVRADLRARSLFMEILRHPAGITHALRRMNRYGVLAAYIPAFANIVGRMQYDLYHVYTVDEHTLRVLRNLRRFSVPEHAHEYPLCSAIAHTIPKLELLYLAGLFHDIAKGRGGDHSLIGARDAWDFCQLHGLSEYDSRLVAWLVEEHLILSMTAQRKDLSDPDVVQNFAAQVGDTTRLDYLYLLTVADSRGTNPQRWNSWKDALLRELYHNARRALLRGLDNPQAQDDLIAQKQGEALRLLAAQRVSGEACRKLWHKLNLDYFLLASPDEIAWHTRLVLGSPPGAPPLVAIRPVTARGGTEIFIYAPDRAHLFSRITALLDQLRLGIMDARIMTTDEHMALNTFYVLELEGETVGDAMRMEELKNALEVELRNPGGSGIQVARRAPRQHRHFPIATEITFAPDGRNQRTVMRLTTLDRPGLLAEVGAVFEACGIRLQNAKIATIGAEVDDVFFVTSQDEGGGLCPDALACLRREIHRRLESADAALPAP
jgi:[protein-PII] uridylyltransferase